MSFLLLFAALLVSAGQFNGLVVTKCNKDRKAGFIFGTTQQNLPYSRLYIV